MKTRILSALIMLPLLIIVYIRGPLLWALAFLVAIVGSFEFFRGFASLKIYPSKAIAIASIVGLYGAIILSGDSEVYLLWLAITLLLCFLMLFKKGSQLDDSFVTLLGILYVAFLSSHIVMIDKTSKGPMVFCAVLIAVGTDIFAYFIGISLGKHKLCPSISPKKTIEGSLGGILGSVILCSAFGYLIFGESIYHFIIIGFVGSIFAQLGDLTASSFKRHMGIKDYGDLIPGHGGILDRFDSLLFSASFLYYYIIFFML